MAKRVYRNAMSQQQKDKIAAAQQGRHLTDTTRARISRSLQRYWAQLPYKPEEDQDSSSGTDSTPTSTPPPLDPYGE